MLAVSSIRNYIRKAWSSSDQNAGAGEGARWAAGTGWPVGYPTDASMRRVAYAGPVGPLFLGIVGIVALFFLFTREIIRFVQFVVLAVAIAVIFYTNP